ncbi:Protein that coordinates expression of mitochondrially-encoded proteins [Rhizina undulata]
MAVCIRCQFRYAPQYRLGFVGRGMSLRGFTSSVMPRAKEAPASRKLPPPKVLILEPPGPRNPRMIFPGRVKTNKAPLASAELEDLSAAILTYEREAVLDATKMEISLLRPARLKVSKERYKQLSGQLAAAFNRDQLMCYYSAETADGKIVPEIRKHARKSDVLDAILRQKWGVQVAEEIAEREDVVRKKQFGSNRREIFFLIGRDGRVLRDWAHTYSARITVNVKDSTIQLEASQANIERIMAMKETFLKDTLEEDIDLTGVSRLGGFDEKFITPIARITGTFIERVSENSLRMSSLGPERRENLDDARRLLFTSLDLHFRTTYSLLYSSPPSKLDHSGALFPVYEDQSLPWRFRDREWGRWRTVRSKQSPTHLPPPKSETSPEDKYPTHGEKNTFMTPSQALLDVSEVRRILDARVDAATAGGVERGEEERKTTYEAVLGHLLHSPPGNSPAQKIHDFIKTPRQRVLCNNVPGATFLTHHMSPLLPSASETSESSETERYQTQKFTIKFTPSPWKYPQSFERYPTLSMTLSVDRESGEPHSPVVEAVQGESVADVMVPTADCDVRFVRREAVYIGVEEAEMKSWLHGSRLNIFGRGLRAKAGLKVRVPGWMISPTPSPVSEVSVEGEGEGEVNGELVEYIYSGMEFRREVIFPLTLQAKAGEEEREARIVHAIVEGGVTGGRRTEIKVVASGGDEKGWGAFAEEVVGLVEKLGKFVRGTVRKGLPSEGL